MKRVLFSLLIVVLLFAFVACDSNPKHSPKPEPVEKKVIYIPGYDLIPAAKGLTGFPEGNPFTSNDWNVGNEHYITGIPAEAQIPTAKFYLACNAMSNLPLLPAMQKYEENPESLVKSFESGSLSIFGFPAKVKAGKVNDDGIYLFIEVFEGDKIVTIAEYYYSWKTKTFSYREIVAAFLHNFATRPLTNTIIVFEMNNVPVEESDGIISFSAGVDNEALNPATEIKQYRINLPAETVSDYFYFPFSLMEFRSILDHTGSLVTGAGYKHYYSDEMFTPETQSTVFNTSLKPFFSDTTKQEVYGFTYANQQVTLSDEKCNIEFCYDILTYFFNGFESFKTDEAFYERVENITDIDDFNDLGFAFLEGVEDEFRKNGEVVDLHFPAMFNLSEKKGTTSDFLDSGLFGQGWGVDHLAAFTELFGLEFEEPSDFAKVILMQCGLSEANAEALFPPTT